MDQQSIVMYLSLKGLNAVEIHNDLVATLKGEAKSYSLSRTSSTNRVSRAQRHSGLLRAEFQFSMNQMKEFC
jgi:hypothetical protein